MVARASFFSRLALALLAIVGVVVPHAHAAVRDEAGIHATHKASAHETVEPASVRPSRATTSPRTPSLASTVHAGARVTARLFLLHRAWLN